MTHSSATCEVAARCGGCPQLARTLSDQREQKQERLKAALVAQGVRAPPPQWLTSTSEGYRNRIRVELVDGIPTFFNRDKTQHCMVLQPEVRALFERLRAWAVPNADWLRQFRVAELRAPDRDGCPALYFRRDTTPRHLKRNEVELVSDIGSAPDLPGVRLGWEGGPVALQRFTLWKHYYVLVPVNAFMQVHTLANRLMVEQVVNWAEEGRCETFVDLFAGSGNFALPLAASGCVGRAVELDEAAVRALRQALTEQGLTGCDAGVGDAGHVASALAAQRQTADLVLADPPRAGLRGDVGALVEIARRSVVLVSCRVEAFARDAAALVHHGLTLRAVRLVDMFPHTDHVEVMGLFGAD